MSKESLAGYVTHGPRVNKRSTHGEGQPCGDAHGLDHSSLLQFSHCVLHYIVARSKTKTNHYDGEGSSDSDWLLGGFLFCIDIGGR